MKRSNRKGPSQRQLRVGEQMRHMISEILQRGELHDSRLEGTSLIISEVRVSPDLRHATAFTSELGKTLQDDTKAILDRHGMALGVKLAREMHLKYAPKVKFLPDESIEEAFHIERLIDQERTALKRQKSGDAADESDQNEPGNG